MVKAVGVEVLHKVPQLEGSVIVKARYTTTSKCMYIYIYTQPYDLTYHHLVALRLEDVEKHREERWQTTGDKGQ